MLAQSKVLLCSFKPSLPFPPFGTAVVSEGAGRAAEEAAEQREERTGQIQTQGHAQAT